MSYRVEVDPGARADIEAIPDDPDLTGEQALAIQQEAVHLILALRGDPWLGVEMRARWNIPNLADCRKLTLDLPRRRGKPRFRIVYRNEPSDGAPGTVVVLAVARREGLTAYRLASGRLARHRRRS